MERIIIPNKQKVKKLAIKLGIILAIFFIALLIAVFFTHVLKFASNHSLSFAQASAVLFQGLREESGLMFILSLSFLMLCISPFIGLNSFLKKRTLRVVLDKNGITSQAGYIKKFVAWDNFIQVLPTKYVGRIWMSGGRSGIVYILDTFDFSELNSEINIFKNKEQ